MTSALVIGADGAIGSALYKRLIKTGSGEIYETTQRTLDLARPRTWTVFPAVRVAYLCAAVSKLDACERDRKRSRQVNVTGIAELATRLKAANIMPVFLSSNHVFDGSMPHRKSSDATCPINEYGRQKAEGEQAILAAGGAVLRLTKVIAPGDMRIDAWRRELELGETIAAFDDVFLSPVTLDNVLDTLVAIGESSAGGIYQLSGKEDVSYFDFACALARHLQLPETRVERGSGANALIPIHFRPRYSSYEVCVPRPVHVPNISEMIPYALSNLLPSSS